MNIIIFAILIALYSQKLFAATGHTPTRIPLSCSDRAIIAPVRVNDPIVSEYVAESVAKGIEESLNCQDNSPILEYKSGLKELDYVGTTTLFNRSPPSLYRRSLAKLYERTSFSYLIEIVPPQNFWEQFSAEKNIRMEIRWYSFNSENEQLTLRQSTFMNIPEDKKRVQKSTWTSNILSKLTPNSLQLNTLGAESLAANSFEGRNDSGQKYQIEESGTRSQWSTGMSSLVFDKIEHPDSYRMFDYEFSLFPVSRIFFLNESVKLSKENQPQDQPKESIDARIYFLAGCTHATGKLSLFSILGTTYAGLGFGLCLVHNESEGARAVNYFDTLSSFNIGHRFFWSKHWFSSFEVDGHVFNSNIWQKDNVILRSLDRTYLNIGYYEGDIEGLFSRFWRTIGLY